MSNVDEQEAWLRLQGWELTHLPGGGVCYPCLSEHLYRGGTTGTAQALTRKTVWSIGLRGHFCLDHAVEQQKSWTNDEHIDPLR